MVDYKLWLIATIEIVSLLFPTGLFSYVDEILAVISAIYICRNYKYLVYEEKLIIKLLIVFIIVGCIGTFRNRYQLGLWPIFLDMEGCTKFFLVYILGRHYTQNLSDAKKKATIKAINLWLIPFVIVGCVCGIINFFIDIGMSYETRMGFRTFKYIFTDSAHIGLCWYMVMMFLTANYMITPRLYNFIIILMGLIVWTLTFKSRAVLFVILYLLLFFWIILHNKKLKLNLLSTIVVVGFSIFITFDQIETYFLSGNEKMPRFILLNGGIETMVRFFPFGAGFGTYGTDVAVKYYSNLYYELGYDKLWGLTPEEPIYAHDSYWPAIMGEFGITGVLLLFVVFYFIYKLIIVDYSVNKYATFYGIFALITQLFASVPTSVFFQSNTVFLFLLLPLITLNNLHSARKKTI